MLKYAGTTKLKRPEEELNLSDWITLLWWSWKNMKFSSFSLYFLLKEVRQLFAKHENRKFWFLHHFTVIKLLCRPQNLPDAASDEVMILGKHWLNVNGKVSLKPLFCQNSAVLATGTHVSFTVNETLINSFLFGAFSDTMFYLLFVIDWKSRCIPKRSSIVVELWDN